MKIQHRFYGLTFLCCMVVAFAFSGVESRAFAQDGKPSMNVRVEPSEIYTGESAKLIVSVSNAKLDNPPEFKGLEKNFLVETLPSSTSTSLSIMNSRRVENRTVNYNYRITPRRSGSFTIEPPEIKSDTQVPAASPVTITVLEQTKTDLVLIETNVAPSNSIYPLVPFEVSVDVYVKEYPSEYSQYDPITLISHNLGAPQLSIPWLESRFFDDVVLAEPINDWLNSLAVKDYGFTLNNYQLADHFFSLSFSFFDNSRKALYFLPKPVKVERTDSSGEKLRYWKYSFVRKMRASSADTLTFAPSTLKGSFLDFSSPDDPVSRNVFLSTEPAAVQIKAIPEEDAPESYLGIYGKITQEAALSSKTASVGDVINLSLEYGGYGSFTLARAPEISELEGIKDVFRVYPASERSTDSGVAFDYKLRPLKQGNYTFPEIKTSYFNVESGNFETLTSDPFPIEIKEGVLTDDLGIDESAVEEFGPQKSAALDDDFADHRRRFRTIATSALAAIALLGLSAGLFFASRAAWRANAQRIASSNRRIIDSAKKEVAEGLSKLDSAPYEGFSQIRLAFLSLVGKRLPNTLDSYTDAEILTFLDRDFAKEREKNPETSKTLHDIKEFFQRSEEFRFGGGAPLGVDAKPQVAELFDRWTEALLKRTRKLSTIARNSVNK